MKNLTQIARTRQEVLKQAQGEAINLYNHERFGQHLSPAHVSALLEKVDSMRVIYIAKEKKLDPSIIPLMTSGKLKIKYLPLSELDSKVEILAFHDKTFFADENAETSSTDPLVTGNMWSMLENLWDRAEAII